MGVGEVAYAASASGERDFDPYSMHAELSKNRTFRWLCAVGLGTVVASSSAQGAHQALGDPTPPTRAHQESRVPPWRIQQGSGVVVADSFWSQALGIQKHALVRLPPSYRHDTTKRYSVVYYLHGAWGSEQDWVSAGHLPSTLDSLERAGLPEMIVVMPDGDDGWYTTWNWLGDWSACRRNPPRKDEPADRYCVPWPHYDDYIARDLVSYIDRRYRTLADRAHRGIAGLSMGGYGAVSLALAYPDVYAAAASHSGVLAPALGGRATAADTGRFAGSINDLRARYSPQLWRLMEPAFGKDLAAWSARDPITLARRLIERGSAPVPALYADCGVADPFLAQNRYFVRSARALGLPLDYAEYPGEHDWPYWRAHVAESASWLARKIATR